MADNLTIGGQQIKAGTKQVVRLRVTQDLDGGEVAIWVHVIHGAQPGPTLGLFGLQHGDEWITLELMRQSVAQLDPTVIAGTVLMVPVCNPVALGTGQRNTQPESDGPDFNRVWPGVHTWLAESMVKAIDREVVQRCNAVIDFHLGPWGSCFGEVFYGIDYPDQDVVRRCREMGVAFGYPSLGCGKVVEVFPGPRSLMGYAGAKLGIPALGVEIGGAGFSVEQERGWWADAVRGIKNTMRHLGMLDQPLEKPDRILTYTRTVRVNPTVGGLLVPEREPDQLLREVKREEVLGRIISPYTFEELERLEAPCDGCLVYLARSYPVRPGHWAFGLADADGAEWITP
jgi:predicted deacylase